MPPAAQIQKDVQNGKPVHQPTITRPGSTKMMADSVPAADATVCTMLFSRIVESLNRERNAIEMTAAEIDIGRGEDQRDQHAEDDAPQRQFQRRAFGRHSSLPV